MGTLRLPSKFFPWIVWTGSTIDETRAACFDLLSRMDDRQNGIREHCGAVSSGRSRKIACPGCGGERHSSGTGECAGTQRLSQRSERHRQCGQSACDPAAGNHCGDAAHRIPSCCLPDVPGAASGKDQTNAICGIQIPPLGQSNRQGARQADRRQGSKHLQGMLSSLIGLACSRRRNKAAVPLLPLPACGGLSTYSDSRIVPLTRSLRP